MNAETSTRIDADALRLSDASFRQLASLITKKLGIKMSETKIPMLQSRLQRRLRVTGMQSIDDYTQRIVEASEGDPEVEHFINAVTTNKTDFFREPQHFKFLADQALPDLDEDTGRPWRAKVWCAGCSTGEESYTLAMVLHEFGARRGNFEFRILATDVSTRVLGVASEGIYTQADIEPVSQELRERYVLRSRDPQQTLVKMSPRLRERIRFHPLNFMEPDYPVSDVFDVIFFRNVAIYFDRPTQEAVVNKLCRHLRPGGYLFIGHSESLVSLNVPLRMVASAVYKKHSL